MKYNLSLFILLLLCLIGCRNNGVSPYRRVVADSVMTAAQVKNYGQYYQGLDCGVYSLCLLSKGLTMDTLGAIKGTGTAVVFTDIFTPLAATAISPAQYTLDSVAKPYTVLRGQMIERTYVGATVVLVQDGQESRTYILSEGTVNIQQDGNETDITIKAQTQDRQTYNAYYKGSLNYDER